MYAQRVKSVRKNAHTVVSSFLVPVCLELPAKTVRLGRVALRQSSGNFHWHARNRDTSRIAATLLAHLIPPGLHFFDEKAYLHGKAPKRHGAGQREEHGVTALRQRCRQ